MLALRFFQVLQAAVEDLFHAVQFGAPEVAHVIETFLRDYVPNPSVARGSPPKSMACPTQLHLLGNHEWLAVNARQHFVGFGVTSASHRCRIEVERAAHAV